MEALQAKMQLRGGGKPFMAMLYTSKITVFETIFSDLRFRGGGVEKNIIKKGLQSGLKSGRVSADESPAGG